MKNKKAVAYNVSLVVVEVILLTAALLILAKTIPPFKIGERQNAILRTNEKAEDMLLYIDISAEYAAFDAFYKLGQKGMFYSDNSLGNYLGYTYWKKGDKAEYPIDMGREFSYQFNDELNYYLENYPKISIHGNNYEFKIEEKGDKIEITGIASRDVEFNIYSTKAKTAEIGQIEHAETSVDTETKITVSKQYKLEGSERSAGAVVDRIILHHTGDDDAVKTYNALKSQGLSVHYIVDRDGTIYYVVDEEKRAAHASGWNDRSIGIEIVNTGSKDMEYTAAQYEAIKKLINDIAERWPMIQADNEHVIGHYQASVIGKWDPSPNFDWSKIGLDKHILLADLGKEAPSEYGYG